MAETGKQNEGTKVVLIALALAVVAVIMTTIFIERVKSANEENTFSVYLLARDVKPGQSVKRDDFDELKMPLRLQEGFAKQDALTATEIGEILDKVRSGEGVDYERAANDGQLVTDLLFAAPEQSAVNIEPGWKQMSLPVDSRIQPGTLRIGDSVSIQAQFRNEVGALEVIEVMPAVIVVDIGGYAADVAAGEDIRRYRNYRTITIKIKDAQAEKLSMIQKMAVGEFELLRISPAITENQLEPKINDRVLKLLEREVTTRRTSTSG